MGQVMLVGLYVDDESPDATTMLKLREDAPPEAIFTVGLWVPVAGLLASLLLLVHEAIV